MLVLLVTFFSSLTVYGEDRVRTLNDLEGFAAVRFGILIPADTVLRGGTTVQPPPISTWINGDYGEDKGRSYLEGGISTEFLICKHSRYPLTITIPLRAAAGDEEYFFGPPFTYITTGVNIRVPLSFISGRYGKWTAGSNTDVGYYGTSPAEVVHSIGLPQPKIVAVLGIEF